MASAGFLDSIPTLHAQNGAYSAADPADVVNSADIFDRARASVRAFAYGGGVQSTAVLILAAKGALSYDVFLFSNVGEDSENPATLAYIRDVARPYAESHGIELVELRRRRKDGTVRTLRSSVLASPKFVLIPARFAGGPPGRRACTVNWKIDIMARELRRRGATQERPAAIGLGISTDEIERATTKPSEHPQRREYPLLDLRLSRRDCHGIIREEGLPQPSKSSCYFCPYHSPADWTRLRGEHPDLFRQAVELEESVNAQRSELGVDPIYLHGSTRPLAKAVGLQLSFPWAGETCESGYCMV